MAIAKMKSFQSFVLSAALTVALAAPVQAADSNWVNLTPSGRSDSSQRSSQLSRKAGGSSSSRTTRSRPSSSGSSRYSSHRSGRSNFNGRGSYSGLDGHEMAARNAILEQKAAEQEYEEALEKYRLMQEGKIEVEEEEVDGGHAGKRRGGSVTDTQCERGDRECINRLRREKWEEKRGLRKSARAERTNTRRSRRDVRDDDADVVEARSSRRIPEEMLNSKGPKDEKSDEKSTSRSSRKERGRSGADKKGEEAVDDSEPAPPPPPEKMQKF